MAPSTGAIFAAILAVILLFFSGFASGSEIAFFSLSPNDLNELEERARQMNADAVVGIDLDYEVLGQGGSMLMVSASGTAVKLA